MARDSMDAELERLLNGGCSDSEINNIGRRNEKNTDTMGIKAYAKGGMVSSGAPALSEVTGVMTKKTGGSVKRMCKDEGGEVSDIDKEIMGAKTPMVGSNPPVALKKGGGIHIKKSHEGDLSRKMGIPIKDNIPVDSLKKEKRMAEKDDDKKLVKQTTFAINAKKWKK